MAKPRVKANEVRFAYLLLQRLHANVNNIYLLLAVVAWMRGESGGTFNPLNLPGHGRFSSIRAAAYATARYLVTHQRYAVLVRTFRKTYAADQQDQQQQGLDILEQVALSEWDGHFYGTRQLVYSDKYGEGGKWVGTPFDNSKNLLIRLWTGLLGHPVTIPADLFPTPKQAVPQPLNPRGTLHLPPPYAFIQPYAAQTFYEARHEDIPVLPI